MNKIAKNASWIIICKIVQSVLGLLVGMFTARYLGPSNYGLINYASSIASFVIPIVTLGINNVLVQEIIDNPTKEGEIVGTSIICGVVSSFFCIVGVISFASIANGGEKETIIVCFLYSLSLVFHALELIQYWYQAKLKSKITSLISLFAYVLVSIYKIWLLATNKSIYWFAVSNGLDYLLLTFGYLIVYHRICSSRLSFDITTAKRIIMRSKHYILSALMVTIFAHTDKVMLKIMIDDAATGYYSAAVTCANLAGFIMPAVLDSLRPSIFESVKESYVCFQNQLSRVYSLFIYFSLIICLGISLCSRLMICVIYGEAYVSAVSALRIIVWYTMFSYLGAIRNIWILVNNKQKYLVIINVLGAMANVLLNYLLIPVMGINGAALASLVTQFFTNVIVGFILSPIRENNALMIKGLNPKYCVEICKSMLSKHN